MAVPKPAAATAAPLAPLRGSLVPRLFWPRDREMLAAWLFLPPSSGRILEGLHRRNRVVGLSGAILVAGSESVQPVPLHTVGQLPGSARIHFLCRCSPGKLMRKYYPSRAADAAGSPLNSAPRCSNQVAAV